MDPLARIPIVATKIRTKDKDKIVKKYEQEGAYPPRVTRYNANYLD
jgi:hypothetical protein